MKRHSIRRHRHLAALLTMAGLALAACTTGGGGSTATSGSSGSGSGSITVGTASSGLGTFLTGPDGRTLYMFAKDSANNSACASSCADTWPPLNVTAGQQPKAGSGVSGTLATLTRSDGATQVSYNGLPLYHYKGDAKPGDTNGQGVGGVWFVAGAAGGPLSSSAPSSGSSSPPSPPPGGYEY